MKVKNQSIKFMVATMILVGIVAVFLFLYYGKIGPFYDGEKEITVQIIVPDEEIKEEFLTTEATTLREALEEAGLIKGEGEGISFYITEVNGRLADSLNEEWWSITKDGAFSEYGVGSINIEDKDKYELTLMVGW